MKLYYELFLKMRRDETLVECLDIRLVPKNRSEKSLQALEKKLNAQKIHFCKPTFKTDVHK